MIKSSKEESQKPSFIAEFSSFFTTSHCYKVSTCWVDLPAKLTGLRTRGKHAKPQSSGLKFRVPV